MRYLLVVGLILLASATMVHAQQGQSMPALATFEVEAAIDISATDGDFGTLAPGTQYTITADGSVTPMLTDGSTEVGQPILWEIAGVPGAQVSVSISMPAYFQGDDDGFRVPYSVTATSAGWAPASFASGDLYNPFDPRVGTSLTLDLGGAAAVQLGGVISVPVGATAETYSAQFVLTAQATGL
jgi:hypothetical protein